MPKTAKLSINFRFDQLIMLMLFLIIGIRLNIKLTILCAQLTR